MTQSRKPALTVAVALLAAFAMNVTAAQSAKPSANAVAVIGGSSVTQQELDSVVGNRLVRLRTEEYNLRRSVLEELIADRLLAAEAKRRGITTDELIKTEIDAKVATPPTADLDAVYEGMKERFGGISKDEALAQMSEGMRRQKLLQRKNELVASLRAAAGVKVLLEPPRTTISAVGRTRGNEQAPITIVEFSDFECNFCSRASATLKQLESAYGDKVRVFFRDYPLPIHRGAPRAAESAQCAGDQGKFWEMHDRLFSKGGPISDMDIRKYANEVGLDGLAFEQCLASGKHTETWKASQAEATRLGVASTPTFFINGRMISGAMPYEVFAKIIDEELERAGVKSRPADTAGTR